MTGWSGRSCGWIGRNPGGACLRISSRDPDLTIRVIVLRRLGAANPGTREPVHAGRWREASTGGQVNPARSGDSCAPTRSPDRPVVIEPRKRFSAHGSPTFLTGWHSASRPPRPVGGGATMVPLRLINPRRTMRPQRGGQMRLGRPGRSPRTSATRPDSPAARRPICASARSPRSDATPRSWAASPAKTAA